MWLKIIDFQYVNSDKVVSVKIDGGIAVLFGKTGSSMYEIAKVMKNNSITTLTQKWFKLKGDRYINPAGCSKIDFIPSDGPETVQFYMGGTAPAYSSSDPVDVAAVRAQLP